MNLRKVIWEKQALTHFIRAIEYIYNDSPQNALKVKNDIENIIDSLQGHPEIFPPDKYKTENKSNEYRAFEKHHLRISYRVFNQSIRIIKVRHASRNPQSY